MTVTVLLFAQYRVEAGSGSIDLELPAGTTVLDAAEATSGRTGVALAGAMCAVNETYSRPDAPLAHGDRVAFLPPVSGG